MKILFLTHHWKANTHHSQYSGYQQIVINASKENECTVITCGKKNEIRDENGVQVIYVKPRFSRDYFFTRRLAISNLGRKMEDKYDVVHALYSDCGFYQRHPNFISTFHISPFLATDMKFISKAFLLLKYYLIERNVFKRSKAIILMSSNLIKGIERFKSKTVFIPHGINTNFWDSKLLKGNDPASKFVLSVGNNGVDKDLLYEAIAQNPSIKFVVVGLKNFSCDMNNLDRFSGISDAELKDLYYNCSLFIRPMSFATANNSVLEALSMDRPVLISTPDGLYDYFDNNLQYIKVVKSVNFVSELNGIVNQQISTPLIQNSIRDYAIDHFDWKVIYNQTKPLYY